jgi:chorismate mutase/prephenate dehydratase
MSVKRLRRKIDELDRRLVRLLNARARLSLRVGRLKRALGLPLFIHEREREIARNVRRASRGPLSHRALTHLYEELLRLTRVTVRAALRKNRKKD